MALSNDLYSGISLAQGTNGSPIPALSTQPYRFLYCSAWPLIGPRSGQKKVWIYTPIFT